MPRAWRARAKMARESESHITSVGEARTPRRRKEIHSECYPDIIRYYYIENE
jgi:hypothetical protein